MKNIRHALAIFESSTGDYRAIARDLDSTPTEGWPCSTRLDHEIGQIIFSDWAMRGPRRVFWMLIYAYLFALVVGGVLLGASVLLGGHDGVGEHSADGDAGGADATCTDVIAGWDPSRDLGVAPR